MSALITLECLNVSDRMHKIFIISLHTPQVTQTTSLPKTKPKWFFYIHCDQLTPSMAIILFVHALHLGRVVSIQMDGRQFKQDIPIEDNRQELDFSRKDIVVI
jgi:hypothetical protein